MKKLLFILLMAIASTAQSKSAKTPESYQQQAEQIVEIDLQKIPAYGILAKQQPSFRPAWQEFLRQQLIVGNDRKPHETSRAIALALALNSSNNFLLAADNASVDAYFQQQRMLLQKAQQDSRLCRILLNTPAQRSDQSGSAPWLLDKHYRGFMDDLQDAATQLIVSGKNQWPRTLPNEQSQQFMQRIVSQMAATYGPDSLQRYELMSNENASPDIRCKGLHQLYETIGAHQLELRAQLVRSFFGGG